MFVDVPIGYDYVLLRLNYLPGLNLLEQHLTENIASPDSCTQQLAQDHRRRRIKKHGLLYQRGCAMHYVPSLLERRPRYKLALIDQYTGQPLPQKKMVVQFETSEE
ncbi:hypothetical protein ACTFIY_002720 [Dictyostelium cf. discoideum]